MYPVLLFHCCLVFHSREVGIHSVYLFTRLLSHMWVVSSLGISWVSCHGHSHMVIFGDEPCFNWESPGSGWGGFNLVSSALTLDDFLKMPSFALSTNRLGKNEASERNREILVRRCTFSVLANLISSGSKIFLHYAHFTVFLAPTRNKSTSLSTPHWSGLLSSAPSTLQSMMAPINPSPFIPH